MLPDVDLVDEFVHTPVDKCVHSSKATDEPSEDVSSHSQAENESVGAAVGLAGVLIVFKTPVAAEITMQVLGKAGAEIGSEAGMLGGVFAPKDTVPSSSDMRQNSQHKGNNSLLQKDVKGNYLFK